MTVDSVTSFTYVTFPGLIVFNMFYSVFSVSRVLNSHFCRAYFSIWALVSADFVCLGVR